MGMTSGGVSSMVFRPVFRGGFGQLYLDGQTLNILMMLDGKKTIDQVAQQAGIILTDLRKVIIKLIKMRLVESVERAVTLIDRDFLEFLVYRMSLAVGPLGEIVVDDCLEDMGFTRNNFPSQKSEELVNLLSQEIQREERRREFMQVMIKEVRQRRFLD